MSTNLDRIARVDISLDTPISNNANFDSVLIIGHAPKSPVSGKDIPVVGIYNTLADITELGFVTSGEGADPVGVAARVAFSQTPRPHEIYVAIVGDSTAVGEDGEEIGEGPSTVTEVLNLALETNGWYCVCPVGLEKSDVVEAIQWTETQNKICGYIETNIEQPVVTSGLYMRSFGVFAKVTESQTVENIPDENKYGTAVAMAVKAMTYHAGSETWALKSVSAITPSKLSATFIAQLETANVSYVVNIASRNVTMNGKTNGGEWIDVIRFRDWLQNDMQVRVANLLVVNPKIPYTDGGISLVENQMLASLKEGQRIGGIAPTEYDVDGNAVKGYITHVPLASELTSTQKASRILKDCRFSARIAGAIHLVEIEGNLTYETL